MCIQETFWINLEFRSKKIHTNFVTWRHKWVVELGPGEPVAIFGSPSSQTGAQNSLWWGWKLFCSRSGIFCLKVFSLWLLQDPEFALKTFLLTVSWWLWWTTFETLNKVERSEVHQVWNGSIQSSLRTNEISLFTASLSKDIQESTPTRVKPIRHPVENNSRNTGVSDSFDWGNIWRGLKYGI